MTPSKFIKRVLGLVTCMVMAVAFNAAAGATCAVAIGCAPEAGAIAGNVTPLQWVTPPPPERSALEC